MNALEYMWCKFKFRQPWPSLPAWIGRITGGRWVVMGWMIGEKPFHALSGGEAYGMDYDSGRFSSLSDARAFAKYRNDGEPDALPRVWYYVSNENDECLPRNYSNALNTRDCWRRGWLNRFFNK